MPADARPLDEPDADPDADPAGGGPRPDRTAANHGALVAATRSVLELVGSPEVGRSWGRPSALEGMTVGGLAAHVVTAVSVLLIGGDE